MKFLTYRDGNTYQLGMKTARGVVAVAAAVQEGGLSLPDTPDAFYRAGLDALEGYRALENSRFLLDEAGLALGPAVPDPGKIICVGLNYRKHAAETGSPVPEKPVLFSKFNNTIAAAGDDIPYTTEFTEVDYEAELVAVMGRRARSVPEAQALDYVLGYCNGNDISERDLQLKTPGRQWLLGKTPDKFLPIGPYLVTADEVGDPQQLGIRGWLNGQLRQNSSTSDMIYTVAQVIAYASRFITLEAGDIISTGTPEGVILGMENKVWMKPGDEFTIEIDKLGRLTNRFVEA